MKPELTALIEWATNYPTQKLAAKALNISPVYMSDLLNGRRDVPDWLLDRLGLKRVVVAKADTK